MKALARRSFAWTGAFLAVAAFAAHAGDARAEASPAILPGVTWDCWLGTPDMDVIRCIAETDPPREPDALPDEAAEFLLAKAREALRAGNDRRAEALIREHGVQLRHGDLWHVPLHGTPLESSWLEGRVDRLVRAGLCRGISRCSVRVVRPGLTAASTH